MENLIDEVKRRDVIADDLPIFFEKQLDSMANYMAAFTTKDPWDWDTFMNHWTKIIDDEKIPLRQ